MISPPKAAASPEATYARNGIRLTETPTERAAVASAPIAVRWRPSGVTYHMNVPIANSTMNAAAGAGSPTTSPLPRKPNVSPKPERVTSCVSASDTPRAAAKPPSVTTTGENPR